MLCGSLCTSYNFNSLTLWARCFEGMPVLLPHFIFPSSCCNGHFIFPSSCCKGHFIFTSSCCNLMEVAAAMDISSLLVAAAFDGSNCCNDHFNLLGSPMLQLYFVRWVRCFKGVVLVYSALLHLALLHHCSLDLSCTCFTLWTM